MFQLILPFQLELPFEGPRVAVCAGRGAAALTRAGMAQPLSVRPSGRRGGRPSRSERQRQALHSLELPLSIEQLAVEAEG